MADYIITITPEDIQKAQPYVSLSVKEQYARAVATVCLEPVEITNEGIALPTMFRENKKIKAQYMMGVLALLLGRDFPVETLKDGTELSGCMREECFDDWASSYVINQLERLKRSKDQEIANKVFDLLYEYKNIEYLVTCAIRDDLDVRNDGFNRAVQYFGQEATEAITNLMLQDKEELSDVSEKIKELKKDAGRVGK